MANKAGSLTGQLSPEIIILGYLTQGSRYGYEMHKQATKDLEEVWHISQSQLYSIIKRLASRGEIAIEEVTQEKLPSRQLLHLTEQGKNRFNTWLLSVAQGSTRVIRLEFVTRIYFLSILEPVRIPRIFEAQINAVDLSKIKLERRLALLPPTNVFNKKSIQLRIMQLDVTKKWLENWKEEI